MGKCVVTFAVLLDSKVAEPLILLLAIAGVAAIIETVIGRFIE